MLLVVELLHIQIIFYVKLSWSKILLKNILWGINFTILLKKISTFYIGILEGNISPPVSPRETSNFQENAITCYDRTRIAACESRVYCRFPLRCYFLFLWAYHGRFYPNWVEIVHLRSRWNSHGCVPIIIYNNWRSERSKNFSSPSYRSFNFSRNLSTWLSYMKKFTFIIPCYFHYYSSWKDKFDLLKLYYYEKNKSKVRGSYYSIY